MTEGKIKTKEKKPVNIVLISPPDVDYINAIETDLLVIDPPIGLAYVASVLRDNGMDVKIIDGNALKLSIEDVVELVANDAPDFVGITVYTFMVEVCAKIAKGIKEKSQQTKIIFGGPHIHPQHEEVMRMIPFVDYCVIGEGEYPTLELIKAVNEGNDLTQVKSIAYRLNGKIIINQQREYLKNLDELPFPARDLLPFDAYRSPHSIGGQKPFTLILSSRGCPFACHFCACNAVWGNQRRRSVENVLDEIEFVYKKYNIKAIRIEDDLFTLNKKWAIAICRGMVERGLNKIEWETNGRVGTLSKELLVEMRNANCKSIALGIEFGNQRIIDFAEKGLKIDQVFETVKLIKESGIRVKAYFMIGYPTETKETIEDTIKLSQRLDLDYALFSLATPFPGTRLYKYVMDKRLLKSNDWKDYRFGSARTCSLDGISEDDLIKLWNRAGSEFYYRPKQMLKILRWHPKYVMQLGLKKADRSINNLLKNRMRDR
ncbi:Ribosomal protein S12 methylthiotransferase RimO [uncultured archaeon]|nr:Ribosomal protein S12 methylthiotransferase RimO [uncultured archaeon]